MLSSLKVFLKIFHWRFFLILLGLFSFFRGFPHALLIEGFTNGFSLESFLIVSYWRFSS